VKIIVLDIDDNKPVFTKNNITIGKFYIYNKKFWEEIMTYLPSILHAPRRKLKN
jgi:hypothetical protein